MPKTFLVDCWLCVAFDYPTTPTDYPNTTRGTHVGMPVTENIDFCGYLRFLSVSFVWIIWVQYATDNLFWTTTRVRFIGHFWYFNPQWTAGWAINKVSCVSNSITHWNNCTVAVGQHKNQGIWRGLGGGGGPFWLHRETLTFKVPAAYHNTTQHNTMVFQIGVNKIPPKFDTLFVMSLEVVWLFKGLTAWRL